MTNGIAVLRIRKRAAAEASVVAFVVVCWAFGWSASCYRSAVSLSLAGLDVTRVAAVSSSSERLLSLALGHVNEIPSRELRPKRWFRVDALRDNTLRLHCHAEVADVANALCKLASEDAGMQKPAFQVVRQRSAVPMYSSRARVATPPALALGVAWFILRRWQLRRRRAPLRPFSDHQEQPHTRHPYGATTNGPYGAVAHAPYVEAANSPYGAASPAPHAGATNSPYGAASPAPHDRPLSAPHLGSTNGLYGAASLSPRVGATNGRYERVATAPYGARMDGSFGVVEGAPSGRPSDDLAAPRDLLTGEPPAAGAALVARTSLRDREQDASPRDSLPSRMSAGPTRGGMSAPRVIYPVSPTVWQPDDRILTEAARERVRALTDEWVASIDRGCRVIRVASSEGSRSAKSQVAAQLAFTAAEHEAARVLLVELDRDAPHMHQLLGVKLPRGLGFSEQLAVLAAGSGSSEPVLTRMRLQPTLELLIESEHGAPAVHDSQHLQRVIAQERGEHDLIVIDGPVVADGPDVAVPSGSIDNLVFVVALGTTEHDDAKLVARHFGGAAGITWIHTSSWDDI